MMMKQRRSLSSKATNYENSQVELDYEGIYELVDNGYRDKDIARDLNISESYFKSLRRQMEEDY
jgi:DNA-binding NarL/FixJ family response regulator